MACALEGISTCLRRMGDTKEPVPDSGITFRRKESLTAFSNPGDAPPNLILKLRQRTGKSISVPVASREVGNKCRANKRLSGIRDGKEWLPPPYRSPISQEDKFAAEEYVTLEGVCNDAQLYIFPEKLADGPDKLHSLLKMPSTLRVDDKSCLLSSHTLNILMVDASSSMSKHWRSVVLGWNNHVAPSLRGRTRLYVFSTEVMLLENRTQLQQKDFVGGGTDLVGAFQTIITEIHQCPEKYIKVFLVTDGDHSASKIRPETIIEKVKVDMDKVCNVFVLGIGNDFPVKHSIDIRSRLHTGNSNAPYFFKAEKAEDIIQQMTDIGRVNTSSNYPSVQLSIKGSVLPGTTMKSTFNMGEWVYFPLEPQQVQQLTLTIGKYKVFLNLQPRDLAITKVNELFRQWNSMIIQLHLNKEKVPEDVLTNMERFYNTQLENQKVNGFRVIQDRLDRKRLKTYEAEFRVQLKNMRSVLTETFESEQQLADMVLCTTVDSSKYKTRAFQFKGHTDKDFAEDCKEFMKVYNVHKAEIQKIDTTPEDCCRVTLTSTVSDLQDDDFQELFKLGKYEFLKQFTISGIPVFAPTRDSLCVNPWSYTVRSMLNSPYTIMSQVSLENFAETNEAGETHKDVKIKWDEDSTRFNAIVPVFPPEAAKVMQHFVNTRLYATCVTFAVLKNPHIVDFDVHMAALGSTWIHILCKHPNNPRPEFVRIRMKSIEATAALYIDRGTYVRYWNALKTNTAQALMTEGTQKIEGKTLKCESLVKPMFILHLNQLTGNAQSPDALAEMVRKMILEYVGRCLSQYKVADSTATPFTDFFLPTQVDEDELKNRCDGYIRDAQHKLRASHSALLETFFTLEEVKKAAKLTVAEDVKQLTEELAADIPIRVNLDKVKRLRNISSAGGVSWSTLQTFAKELGLAQSTVDELFSERNAFVYTAHALQYRTSRSRLSNEVLSYDASVIMVVRCIQRENHKIVANNLLKKLCQLHETAWLEAYAAAHQEVVQPMTRQNIITQARKRSVNVTEETFDRVYKKYRPDVGLLGNACQSEACPHYLLPSRRYNQHSSVERRGGQVSFLHALHRVAYQDRDKDLATALSHLQKGTFTKKKQPLQPGLVGNVTHELKQLQNKYKTK